MNSFYPIVSMICAFLVAGLLPFFGKGIVLQFPQGQRLNITLPENIKTVGELKDDMAKRPYLGYFFKDFEPENLMATSKDNFVPDDKSLEGIEELVFFQKDKIATMSPFFVCLQEYLQEDKPKASLESKMASHASKDEQELFGLIKKIESEDFKKFLVKILKNLASSPGELFALDDIAKLLPEDEQKILLKLMEIKKH